jgi:imidazolonepropionase-like amidohydrolase
MIKNFFSRLRSMGIYKMLVLALWAPVTVLAQDEKDLGPVTRSYAITNVNIIQGPGRKVDMGVVLIKDGLITGVGKGLSIPPEAIVIKADSMYVYAGFIDGLSRAGVVKPKEETKERVKDPGNPPPDRAGITPQLDVRNFLNPMDKSVEEARGMGFTVAQVVPYGNFLPGQSAIVLLGGKTADDMVLVNKTGFYSEFSTTGNVYPATILGIMAKWRELYRQAVQAKSYEAMYASNRAGLERPSGDRILEAFYPVIDQRIPVLFKTEKILDVQRAFTLKSDLNFPLVIADVKNAWPMIDKIKASGVKVFLSLDLPEEKKEEKKDDKKNGNASANAKPKTSADLEKEALEKRKKEAIANYNAQPANFQKAGVLFGFSSITAKSKDIPANLRRMIAAGLSEDAALAALTTTPAQLLGLSDRMGTIDNGKMANLVISDKPYFNEKAKVRYVFVDGVLNQMEAKETKKSDGAKVAIAGTWSYTTETPQGARTGKLVIKDENGNFSGTISNSATNKESDIKNVSLDGNSLSFSYTTDAGGNSFNVDVSAKVDGDSFEGTMTAGNFGNFPVKASKDPKK